MTTDPKHTDPTNKNEVPENLEPEHIDAQTPSQTDALARLQADFENFRRRTAAEKAQWETDAVMRFFKPLIGKVHGLHLASTHTQDKDAKGAIDQLFSAFESAGFKRIHPEPGSAIDPNQHEVLLTVPDSPNAGNVHETLESGWSFAGKVIVPAKVSAGDTK